MISNELVYSINTCSISELVPIGSIRTEQDLQDMKQKGYFVDYTAVSFAEDHPTVDANKISVSKSFSAPTFYWDEENIILFPLHLFGKQFLPINQSDTLEAAIENGVSAFYSTVETGNFSTMLRMQFSDQMRLEYLQRLIDANIIPDEKKYQTFLSAYRLSDFGFSCFEKPFLDRIFALKTEEDRAETASAVAKLPDAVTIYRGEGDKSTARHQAYSWSLSPEAAVFFATRLSHDHAVVYETQVKKSDIIEYNDRGSENEVLVAPEAITGEVKEYRFNGYPWLEELVDKGDVVKLYFYFVEECDFQDLDDGEKGIHDAMHSLRVLFLCCLIYMEMGLDPFGEEGHQDMRILADAARWHDVGRTHDGECSTHGRESAVQYRASVEDASDVAAFIMAYHCCPDETAITALDASAEFSGYTGHVKLLYDIFKDADGLDRVRLGNFELDFTRLRTDTAKKLPLVARLLLDNLEEPWKDD